MVSCSRVSLCRLISIFLLSGILPAAGVAGRFLFIFLTYSVDDLNPCDLGIFGDDEFFLS